MKNLLLLFISCFLLFQGSDVVAQTKKIQVKNDLMETNLKGKVKSVKEITFWVVEKSGVIRKGKITGSTLTKYDINGKKIELNEYDQQGSIENKYIFNYDSLSNKFDEIQYRYGDSNKFITNYDSTGKVTDKYRYNEFGQLVYIFNYKYNIEGYVIYEKFYTDKGNLEGIAIQKYDTQENLIEESFSNLDSSYLKKSICKYDNNRYKIEETSYSQTDNDKYKYIFKYDSKGTLISKKVFNLDNTFVKEITDSFDLETDRLGGNTFDCFQSMNDSKLLNIYIIMHDSLKNEIQDNWYNNDNSLGGKLTYIYNTMTNTFLINWYLLDGSFGGKCTCIIDSNGNPIEKNWNYYSSLFTLAFKYEYDDKCNWVNRIEYQDGKPTGITERQFEYY